MATDKRVGLGRTADILVWDEGAVLKLYHAGWPRATVEREAAFNRAAEHLGLPVPKSGDVLEVDGRFGIVYERLDGPTGVQAFVMRPWQVVRLAHLLADLQAEIHTHTAPASVEWPSQRESLVRAIQRAGPLADTQKQAALDILEGLPDGDALCHGDYHPENLLLAQHGPVVIDWLTASRGNPLADVARTSVLMRVGAPVGESSPGWLVTTLMNAGGALAHSIYLRRYLKRTGTPAHAVEAWQVPLAAARLTDEIPGEEPALLRLIEDGLWQARQQ